MQGPSIEATVTDAPLTGDWERHTTGIGSKIMKKMGYRGTGLGKLENGIKEPITVSDIGGHTKNNTAKVQTPVLVPDEPKDTVLWPPNTVLITGSSMLQGVNEKRMSRKLNVKVRPHPGASIRDLYDHLNALLRKKPKYLILHVGTNDAANINTSSEDLYDRLLHQMKYAES